MRPVVRKPKVPERKGDKVKRPDEAKILIKVRKEVGNALAEVKIARGYLAKQYAGPEHESLEYAQRALERAMDVK